MSGGLNETRYIIGKCDTLTPLRSLSVTAEPLTCLPGTGDVFVRLAADGSAGRGEEGGALVLGAPLGLEHVDGDFVLAGEQQAREVDVVLLRREKTHYSAADDFDVSPRSTPAEAQRIMKHTAPGRIAFPLRPRKHAPH